MMSNDDYEKVRRGIEAGFDRQRNGDLQIKVGIFSRGEFRAFLQGVANHCRLNWTEPYLAPWVLRGDGIAIDAVRHYCEIKARGDIRGTRLP